MDNQTILIAVIAAGATLLGSVVPTLVNLWATRRQRQFEIKKYLLDHQLAAYVALLDVLQALFNDQSNQALFRDFQQASTRVAIYGDKKAAEACQKYYLGLISQSQGKRAAFTEEDHKSHQVELLNAMRKGMDLQQINNFAIVSFLPDRDTETRA